ncbi:MAG: PAS domain S-box protein [Bacteroidales bacterium]|nr:PAS domain S-box protein [Bacteroidales bacterium]
MKHKTNVQLQKEIELLKVKNAELENADVKHRKDKENLQTLFNAMTDIVFEMDYDGTYINIAPTFPELMFKPSDEIIGKTLHEVFPKPEADKFLKFIRSSLDKNKSVTIEYPLIINNETKWFEGKATPKTKNSVLYIARDITYNKKIEQDIKESQYRFKAFSEATYEGIIIIENGVVIDVNEAVCMMLSYSYNEIKGKPAINFIAAESKELASKNMFSGYDKPYDAIAQRKDGTKFHIEIHGREYKYKGKKTRMTAVRNITERKENEILLQKSREKLQALNTKLIDTVKKEVAKSRKKDRLMIVQSKQAAMGEMIGNIAHQWRQPLNDIGLYIQNLQDIHEYDELTEENLNEIVNKTMNKLEYMSQTIDDFRNFFRSDKEKTKFSLSKCINKILLLTEASFKNNNIETILILNEGIFIYSYQNEFSQAVLNIINNARDVLIERKIKNPKVKINLSRKDKKIILTVSDNAGGISEDIIDKIYEPYFTTKEQLAGTGLGLYISKTIIERNMSGKLTVKNIKDGVEFRIELNNE